MEITHLESSHSLETLPVQKYILFKSGSDIEYHYPESQDSEKKIIACSAIQTHSGQTRSVSAPSRGSACNRTNESDI